MPDYSELGYGGIEDSSIAVLVADVTALPDGGWDQVGAVAVGLRPLSLREAVRSRLAGSSAIAAMIGTRIYFGALPQSQSLLTGPALTYQVSDRTRGATLAGSDGTSEARVTLAAWSTAEATSDRITALCRELWDGYAGTIATLEVLSALAIDESDAPQPPRAGTDQWLYGINLSLQVRHRTAYPSGLAH